MPVKCHVIIDALENLAPRHLAADWDNVGLLLGSAMQDITKIFVTLDVTLAAAQYAAANGIDLIVSHHPVIFKGIKHVRTDSPTGRVLQTLIKHDVAVYAAHTNLDAAAGGVNDVLAKRLNLNDIAPLQTQYTEKLVKIVTFVPEGHVESVRNAMAAAGAGHIGNYSHCSFQTAGTGTFLPLAGTRPFIGEQGKMEYVPEYRLETIAPEAIVRRVVAAMIKAHPYEEVAYDLYPLLNSGAAYGLGRVGTLAQSLSLADFAIVVKAALGLEQLKIAGDLAAKVRKVAVCGGSGISVTSAAIAAGADVLITGDVKYHEAQDAVAAGLAIIDAGHFATEQPVVAAVASYLEECAAANNWHVAIYTDTINTDVFTVL
ncbi:Nif3-like dinuclear metal center hexameric protein [Sporolituus thermophilus]|uniref:GTP cyclohydrolase 1 type 2 homolog n=1 Tax=Sporolituus thermophilus DSM 23256 TaxID=1123285 RepID=A0A1G7JJR0_9FIRM|nr:Nif3-like dinuclear metal center hexameric protein [Sporolituus thermophilus]SDF24709.1 dinuclear metal center protein, YbgI/SA1388 family [Sporolituus thermophilus DSM 23256]